MYLLYGDETNLAEQAGNFFIYAGVVISSAAAGPLSADIEALRRHYGFSTTDLLKFNSREKPAHVNDEAFKGAKRDLLRLAEKYDVKLLCTFILHDIARSPDEARKFEINRICFHFHCFLNWEKSLGIVFLDTFSGGLRQILQEKFQLGLVGLPYSSEIRMANILGFHEAHIGTSNFTYLVDVVVGSLRYAITQRKDQRSIETCKVLLNQLKPLFIYDHNQKVPEISCFFSPKVVRAPTYLNEYLELYKFLNDNGITCAQIPTDERTY